MKKLSFEDLLKMDISKKDIEMYEHARSLGAEIVLIAESETGYDIGMMFSPDQKAPSKH